MKNTYTVWKTHTFLILQQVVYIVAIGLKRVNENV